jgi:hypothetical protein
VPVGLLVVLLDNFLETGVVELRELGQVVYVRDDVRQILFQQQVFILRRHVDLLAAVARFRPGNCIADFFFAGCDPTDNLLTLHFLEGEDLVQLLLQLVDEALLIFLVPFLLGLAGALLKALLELVVGDVVVVPVFDQRAAQLLSEPVRVLLVRRVRGAIGPLGIELRGGIYFMVPKAAPPRERGGCRISIQARKGRYVQERKKRAARCSSRKVLAAGKRLSEFEEVRFGGVAVLVMAGVSH